MASERRSRDARARAEEALVRFALLAKEHAADFVVIGGLNPDFLAPRAPSPHLGTTDVDILFELGFVYDRDQQDFSWLDRVLVDGGFAPVPAAPGWRWDAILGGTRVRLDLLCDVSDSQGQAVALPGATEASAQNLDGPAAALVNPIERALLVPSRVRVEHPDAPAEIRLRFASHGGYLAAKAAALLARGADKDAYDLMFVVMYGAGGARGAAEAVASMTMPSGRSPVTPIVEAAVKRFVDPESRWTAAAVRQLRESGDDAEVDQLRADVSVAAQSFLRELHEPRASDGFGY